MVRELYRPAKANRKICNCPFCGSEGQLWEYEPEPENFQKVVMCSDEECPMYMPPEGFYFAMKSDAIDAWNTRAPI